MAAQTLAEAGEKVLILDGGITGPDYESFQPRESFVRLRKTDPEQHRYLLGDNFESLPGETMGTGAQLTPARNYLIQETKKYLPVSGDDFSAMESLAKGGLGAGWGTGCCVYSEEELVLCGLDPVKMQRAYQLIADRIGISAANDDARPFTAAYLSNTQPPLPDSPLANTLLNRYAKKKPALNSNGFFLGRPALALLTQSKNGRDPAGLRDMDFYDDFEKAAWRPQFTLDQLRKNTNVEYAGGFVVTNFMEEETQIRVNAIRIGDNARKSFYCRKLILAPGVLGTARIVLRSVQVDKNVRLPLLCNPYTYMPCLVPSRLGKNFPDENNGFAQLSLFHNMAGDKTNIAMASLYNYRSLLLFRLMNETPLNFRDGRIMLQYLLPALMIAGIHHPEKYTAGQNLFLEENQHSPTGDRLHVDYPNDREETHAREKMFAAAFRKLGAWPLKTVRPKTGASIHYAGTLPFSENEKALALNLNGRLHGTKNVFVADGSGFSYLPAKGLTFSLMANAHLVAEAARK